MKISIRVSILTLFVSLLLLVGGIIVAVDYYMQRKDVVIYTNDLMLANSNIIQQRILNFLQPIQDNLNIGAQLISRQLIIPGRTTEFTNFLLSFLIKNPHFTGVGWGDRDGTAYYVERKFANVFVAQTIARTHDSAYDITKNIDQDGKILTTPQSYNTTYDLYGRPWFKEAVSRHIPVVTSPSLAYNPDSNTSVMAVSFSYPIYDASGELKGVFLVDSQLSALSDFINTLKITPHAYTFVFNNKNEMLAGKLANTAILDKLPMVADVLMPWVKASFVEYQKNKRSLFFYSFAGKNYLAFYSEMLHVPYVPCSVAIVLPAQDITQSLTHNLLLNIMIGISVLIGGMVIVSGIARSISRPIVKLADEADAIKDLNFSEDIKQNSYIKEIFSMQQAFNVMKNSLKSFMRYVPVTLIKKMLASGGVAHVGGESKTVTFLFSDIHNFTALSESMSPSELMKYLSEYFDAMTRTVLENQGVLDKYIGDGIMAFWGAPVEDSEHAVHACKCALAMLETLADLNAAWHAIGKPELTIRIGINTGEAVVGNVGSEDRLNYTAMGDSVNIASRLEELNKLYGTTIIINQTTYQLVKEYFASRFLDSITVRGKAINIKAYEIIATNSWLLAQLSAYQTDFERAFALYAAGNWNEARVAFTELATNYPNDQLAKVYLKRCDLLQQNPPQKWQGIWRMG